MVLSRKVFTSVLLAILFASSTFAVPRPSTLKHTTHRVREISPDLKLEMFHPASTFETFGDGIDHPLSKQAGASLEDISTAFVKSHLNTDSNAVRYRTGYTGEVASHAYFTQVHDGIPFSNAVANVALNTADNVVAIGSSFVKPTRIASSKPSVPLQDAILTAEKTINGQYNDHPATLEYVVKDDGSVVLAHVVQIQNHSIGTWVEAFVDAHSNKLVTITDFVAKASYFALPITKQDPTQGFETLKDPQDIQASPNGWHSDGTTLTTTTAGNNAIAFKGSQNSTTSQSSSGLNFIYPQSDSTAPNTTANINAARVNAFYVVNTIHDITYRYGFTEAAYNFQNYNYGKGGAGNDRVTISVQDSNGVDNADFSTPPDGQSGAMRMFLWDKTNPGRDGALENDIVTHENTHGVTNRMTGGGTGRCLQTTEARGLGEGWSDAMADWIEKTSAAVPDFFVGSYVTANSTGIRSYPYSTSATINPLRYSSLFLQTEVHTIGEVWANMLHNVYAALVAAHGFSTTAKTNPTGREGNIVFLHLFLDALALQPCQPSFTQARQAWIQADVLRYAGANKCILWKAFASRGLGVYAQNLIYIDNYNVPAGC